MRINDFKLECYFAQHEFSAPYLLAQSDCESLSVGELLALEPGSEAGLLAQRLGYTETWGDPELRDLVAALYQGFNREHVLMLHGAQEGIFAFMNVMLGEGDHMVAMFPNYQSAYEVANCVPGCACSRWELRDAGDRWELDFDELATLVRPNTRLIAVTSPNNPTGYTFTNAQIEQLCDFCRERDLVLFADEVYRGTELDGEPRVSFGERYEKAIVLGVLSKSYGLPGLRVGWLALRCTELLDQVARYKHYLSICDAAPSEYLAKVALRHGPQLLARNTQLIRANKELARQLFERHPSLLEFKDTPAGPVAFHKVNTGMPIDDFCKLAVQKAGVLLLPASVYDVEDPYVRMGYGRANVPESLARFEEFLTSEHLG